MRSANDDLPVALEGDAGIAASQDDALVRRQRDASPIHRYFHVVPVICGLDDTKHNRLTRSRCVEGDNYILAYVGRMKPHARSTLESIAAHVNQRRSVHDVCQTSSDRAPALDRR